MAEARKDGAKAGTVSVIVPVYKAERYLDRCVRSILDQTCHDLELILVDDGSPDGSPGMCDDWARRDDRVRVIHKQNGGASSARNAALSVAAGQFIAFVDSDDWIEPEMYERLVGLMELYGAQMAICELLINDGRKKIAPAAAPRVEKWGRKECLDRFFRVHGENDTHCVWGGLFRGELLEGFSFLDGRMNEDVLACYVLAEKCETAVYTDEVFYNYFRNRESVTNSRFDKKKLDLLYVWKLVAEQVPALTPEYAYACRMNEQRASFTLLALMLINGYDRRDPEMRQVRAELYRSVRQSYGDLMKWPMPPSRKLLLFLLRYFPFF